MKHIIYDKSLHGSLIYPEGFEDTLKGLSIEEQENLFRIGNGLYRREPVDERRKRACDYSNRLEEEESVEALIINDNMIAGVMVKNCYDKLVACLPEQGYIIFDESEIDGSGYKEYQLFNYLICASEHFNDATSDKTDK